VLCFNKGLIRHHHLIIWKNDKIGSEKKRKTTGKKKNLGKMKQHGKQFKQMEKI
jgi:hypothetical protein